MAGKIEYDKPKSLCACGHTGDGPESDHVDRSYALGHGACKKCNCKWFTWRKWTQEFREVMLNG